MLRQAVEHYRELLTYVRSAVTRNYAEKSISNLLELIEKGAGDARATACMEEFYSLTLSAFANTNNERLWLKTNIRLARLWLDRERYGPLSRKLRELHRACEREDGSDDPSKGTYALEVYALEIQMHAATGNSKRLKALYRRALAIRAGVPHPNIMGVIRECGGKMNMAEENWKEAQRDFFESFRNYDEAGSRQRISVLRYLVLATMLARSDINPFDSPETKPYQNDSRIAGMTALVDAFQRDDVHAYEAALRSNDGELLADAFIAEHMGEVSRAMRSKAIARLVAPYARFRVSFVARRIGIDIAEARDILATLILDSRLPGARIDQADDVVTVDGRGADAAVDDPRLAAAKEWSVQLAALGQQLLTTGEGFRTEDQTRGQRGALVAGAGTGMGAGAGSGSGAGGLGMVRTGGGRPGAAGMFSRAKRRHQP